MDSKGLEMLDMRKQLEGMQEYIQKQSAMMMIEDRIHVVWYFVRRWQAADAEACRKTLQSLPMLFVINKCDDLTEEAILAVETSIREDMGPSAQIFRMATPQKLEPPGRCPQCGNDDLHSRPKLATWHCEGCEADGEFARRSPWGHKELLDATRSILPEILHRSFDVAQKISIANQDRSCHKLIAAAIVAGATVAAVPLPISDAPFLIPIEVALYARIAANYGLNDVRAMSLSICGGLSIAALTGKGDVSLLN